MSTAHIEQFYAKSLKDPAAVQAMLSGTSGPEDFIRNAVAAGKAQGFDFTYEEADAWIKNQQKMKASGELSDSQLEAVAGGKNNQSQGDNAIAGGAQLNAATNWLTGAGNTIASGVTSAAHSVASWFSSW